MKKLNFILSLIVLVGFLKETTAAVTSCYVIAGQTVSTNIGTATACSGGGPFTHCKNTVNAAGVITDRACATSCTPSATEQCCSTDDCNDGVITSCKVVSGATVSTSIGTSTSCTSAAAKFCKNTFNPTSGLITDRACADTCTAASGISCCNADNCNDGVVSSCKVVAGASVSSNIGTSTRCDSADAKFCLNTVSGSGIITDRECAATCTPSATEQCCNTVNCNDGVVTSCKVVSGATVSTNIGTSTRCDSAATKFCQNTVISDVITDRECSTSCTASLNTTCCSTLNCNDATAVPLQCLQCSTETECAAVNTGSFCSDADIGCKTTYFALNGKAQTKQCVSTIFESTSTQEYCTTENCNYKKTLLKCFECTSESDCESTTTSSYCGAESNDVCKTEFVGGQAVSKSCETFGNCIPDENTVCCNSNDCNSNNSILSCFECNSAENCDATTTATQCSPTDNFCSTSFSNGIAVSKSCEQECMDNVIFSDLTKCCSGDSCNSANEATFCFQCTSELDCNTTFTGEICSDSNAVLCQTKFLNKKAQSKSCVATCESGAVCCSDDNCNIQNTNNANTIATSFITFLIPVFIFMKMLN